MLIVIRDLFPDILHAQILESLDTTVASQVNKHTAQVYNQVLYAFHIISFYTSYDVCDVVFSVDND